MPFSHLPATLSAWLALLTGALDRRSAPRLLRLPPRNGRKAFPGTPAKPTCPTLFRTEQA